MQIPPHSTMIHVAWQANGQLQMQWPTAQAVVCRGWCTSNTGDIVGDIASVGWSTAQLSVSAVNTAHSYLRKHSQGGHLFIICVGVLCHLKCLCCVMETQWCKNPRRVTVDDGGLCVDKLCIDDAPEVAGVPINMRALMWSACNDVQ